MSENTLKLPKNYKRPSREEYAKAGYPSTYEEFFARHEENLAAAYASGELTDEAFDADMRRSSDALGRGLPDSCPSCQSHAVAFPEPWTADSPAKCQGCGWEGKVSELLNYTDDEMVDADGDGLPDILHVRSQVRAPGNRSLRARQPTRHRFKQYLFGNPALRLVRKRATRVRADDVRSNLDELISKEAAGILTVHAPNGQRVDLQALKAGRVELSAIPAPAPLVNKPLDSAANDVPAGQNMPRYEGGTFAGDPIAADVGARLAAEKQEEAEKKEPVQPAINAEDPADPAAPVTDEAKDPVDSTASTQPSPELEQTQEQPAAEQAAPEAQPEAAPADPVGDDASKSSKKGGKKGGHK